MHSTWECSDTVANKLTDAYTNIKDTEYSQNFMDVWMNHMQKHSISKQEMNFDIFPVMWIIFYDHKELKKINDQKIPGE